MCISEVVSMQVQSIGNSESNVGFKSRNKMEQAEVIVNLNDSQVKSLAYAKSVDKNKEKKNRRTVVGLFYAMPVVDTIAKGIVAGTREPFSKGIPLSYRLRTMGSNAVGWGVILSVAAIYGAAKKAGIFDSSGTQKAQKKHPIASAFGDFGVLLLGTIFASMGLGKIAQKITEKNPEALVDAESSIAKLAKNINQSKFATRTLPRITEGFEKFANKAPLTAKATGFALRNSLWILLGISLYKSISHANDRNKKISANYHEMKNEQVNAAKYLINKSNVERDILKQNQLELANDLGIVLDQVRDTRQLLNEYQELATECCDERLNNCESCCEPALQERPVPKSSSVETTEIVRKKKSTEEIA